MIRRGRDPAGEFSLAAFYNIHLADPSAGGVADRVLVSPRGAHGRQRIRAQLRQRDAAVQRALLRDHFQPRLRDPCPCRAPTPSSTVRTARVSTRCWPRSAGSRRLEDARPAPHRAGDGGRVGAPALPRIAQALDMSHRTMSRRLEQEGTMFAGRAGRCPASAGARLHQRRWDAAQRGGVPARLLARRSRFIARSSDGPATHRSSTDSGPSRTRPSSRQPAIAPGVARGATHCSRQATSGLGDLRGPPASD